MPRAIIAGAFAIALAAMASFAAGGAKMKITSSAFQEGANIPSKFTCDGALDRELDLPFGAKRGQLDAAMKGHVIAHGELMGRYSRKK
jgi:phosphatidylethanolamine-binding protein (PEBP) family uncharacterized protein